MNAALDHIIEVSCQQVINTLKAYRGRGFSRIATGAMLKYILNAGKTPIWSTGESNEASMRLAHRIGYVRFADVFTITVDSDQQRS